MGNRCVITTKDSGMAPRMAVYLHWRGDVNWVNSFLMYCKLRGFRCPENDEYGWARLCQIAANTIGGTLGIGISTFDYLRYAGDENGVYYIRNWKIVDRDRDARIPVQSFEDLKKYLIEIDDAQPEADRIGHDFLESQTIETSSLKVGDEVFVFDELDGKYEKHTIIGICEDPNKIVNGTRMYKCPIIDKYGNNYGTGVIDYSNNCNNYLRAAHYRKAKVNL